jgi:undecaprenyl phosphate-alpha-L-ara4N flippase subunit ArnE
MALQAFIFIFLAIGLEVLGQTSFKQGVQTVARFSPTPGVAEYLSRITRNTWIHAGIVAYALEIPIGMAALAEAPLSVVFPMLSLSYVGVALAGSLLFGERLASRQRLAIALITIGAALVSLPASS